MQLLKDGWSRSLIPREAGISCWLSVSHLLMKNAILNPLQSWINLKNVSFGFVRSAFKSIHTLP